MVLAFIHARAVFDGGRCFPALVSYLLIRSDQLRRSMFGFRSARSTLAAQWSILRFVVQLSYRSSFAALRFAARSPSSQRAGLDSGCAGKKTYPWVGDYFLGALKSHLATCAFSPSATTISPSACPVHAAADLMAPSSRQGQCADNQRSKFNFDTQLRGNFQK